MTEIVTPMCPLLDGPALLVTPRAVFASTAGRLPFGDLYMSIA